MKSTVKRKRKRVRSGRAEWVDIQMLMDNLRRSYAERIRRHQIALETVEKLQRAKIL